MESYAMFSSMSTGELVLTKELIDGLRLAVQQNTEGLRDADSDEERRIYEARLKELAKVINDVRSCEDHAVMNDKLRIEVEKLSLECEKLGSQEKEGKKNRIVEGFKIGFGLLTALIGVKATRDNMKVLANYEQEHYVATAAEKEAIRQSLDVPGMMHKFESKIGLK